MGNLASEVAPVAEGPNLAPPPFAPPREALGVASPDVDLSMIDILLDSSVDIVNHDLMVPPLDGVAAIDPDLMPSPISRISRKCSLAVSTSGEPISSISNGSLDRAKKKARRPKRTSLKLVALPFLLPLKAAAAPKIRSRVNGSCWKAEDELEEVAAPLKMEYADAESICDRAVACCRLVIMPGCCCRCPETDLLGAMDDVPVLLFLLAASDVGLMLTPGCTGRQLMSVSSLFHILLRSGLHGFDKLETAGFLLLEEYRDC
ncbi:hypothetical protein Nepgr_023959 [Nepenthes gracilis]|uniref:Uncharacterized protein n=1 Tax=Nepenthes gracilis TaxID=150966 RepID=A0AAD3T599_NEPGR|nr:hypothetical protein Nepgr_023959 [Nepenthes gracilis]